MNILDKVYERDELYDDKYVTDEIIKLFEKRIDAILEKFDNGLVAEGVFSLIKLKNDMKEMPK